MSNYTIGLTGLQNTANAIDTTSNNIANANTVGYKAGEYVFADQYFKAVNPSDVNRVGLGSQRLAVRRPATFGTITNSSNPLDLAIGGDGWFRTLTDKNDPKSVNYTRNGQFAVAKDGYIVNQNGQYLTGYVPSRDRTSITDDMGTLSMPPAYENGTQTSVSTIDAVLDSRENGFVSAGNIAFDPAQDTFNSKTTQTVYDSNGTAHTLDVYYRRVTDTQLQITSRAGTGYTYSPGPSSAPNTLQQTYGIIPMTSVLSVQTAPKTTILSSATGQTKVGTTGTGTLTSALNLASNLAVGLSAGDKVYINGIDSGLTVTTGASGSSSVTISGAAVDVPANAAISFYPADVTFNVVNGANNVATQTLVANATPSAVTQTLTLPTSVSRLSSDHIFVNGVDSGFVVDATDTHTGTSLVVTKAANSAAYTIPANATITFGSAGVLVGSAGATSVTVGGATQSLVGQRLFIGSSDTGLTVTSVNTTTSEVKLSGALPTNGIATGAITFKPELAMTLIAPDGTELSVKGTTNKQDSGTILTSVQANVEVYASLDGKFYNHNDTANTFGNRTIVEDVNGAGNYGAVSRVGLIGGRNLDSLIKDSASGDPLFSTKVTLTTQVSNGSQQSTTIPLIFDLDLSNTQLQASSFQVTASVQNGEPRSQLASVSIDDSGNIVGIYGNGRQLYAGQVVLAHFDASEQLIPTGGNSFAPSYMSGSEGQEGVILGRPGEGSFGSIKSQAVEQSNVDLSNELVKLMILQRMYSANSQSLRAFDSTMQDTIRMMG